MNSSNPAVRIRAADPASIGSIASSVLLCVALVLTYSARLLVVNNQTDWDEELYFLIARGWSHGQIPYRDIFDHKAPMVYLLDLIFSGGGVSLPLMRIVWCFVLALSTYALVVSLP